MHYTIKTWLVYWPNPDAYPELYEFLFLRTDIAENEILTTRCARVLYILYCKHYLIALVR